MDEEELHSQIYELIQHDVEECQAQIISNPSADNMSINLSVLGMRNIHRLSYAILPSIEGHFKQGSWVSRTVFDKTSDGVFVYFCAYGTNV